MTLQGPNPGPRRANAKPASGPGARRPASSPQGICQRRWRAPGLALGRRAVAQDRVGDVSRRSGRGWAGPKAHAVRHRTRSRAGFVFSQVPQSRARRAQSRIRAAPLHGVSFDARVTARCDCAQNVCPHGAGRHRQFDAFVRASDHSKNLGFRRCVDENNQLTGINHRWHVESLMRRSQWASRRGSGPVSVLGTPWDYAKSSRCERAGKHVAPAARVGGSAAGDLRLQLPIRRRASAHTCCWASGLTATRNRCSNP